MKEPGWDKSQSKEATPTHPWEPETRATPAVSAVKSKETELLGKIPEKKHKS